LSCHNPLSLRTPALKVQLCLLCFEVTGYFLGNLAHVSLSLSLSVYPPIQLLNMTIAVSNSVEHSDSHEINSRLARQEIPYLLLNPKIRYRVHKNPPLVRN